MSVDMLPYCSAHDEWLIMKIACMSFAYAGWSDTLYIMYLIKLTMDVDNIVFRIIKGAF